MKNPIKRYFQRKRQRELMQLYMSVGAGTILQRGDCLDFRLTHKHNIRYWNLIVNTKI